jgi:predicted Zn-dependent protease
MAAIHELVEQALATSTADGCVVVASERSETNLRWANNSLTTNGQMRSRAITVISVLDGGPGSVGTRAGVVTRSVTTGEELTALVHASEQAARSSSAAEDAAPLVEPNGNDDWEADPVETSVAVFDRFAVDLGAAFGRWRKADRLLFGFAEHALTSTFVATSTGLRRRFDQPQGRLEINAKSPDFVRSAFLGRQTRDFADVNVDALAEELALRLDWAERRIELPAGRYETILPPSPVADLMIDAYWSASARDAEEGRSVFAASGGDTRIGTKLSDLPITLRSDPAEPGLECAPFEIATASYGSLQSVFDNGAPIGPTDWIKAGTLANLARTRSWAAKTGAEPRYMTDNLILDGQGSASLDDLVASTGRGLLLTCLWYIREVDPQTLLLTGLTRDGVYLIEDGVVQGAVNNFRFNESPVDLLGRIAEVGRTEPCLPREWSDWFTRVSMPPIRVPDFNMSTVSPAS